MVIKVRGMVPELKICRNTIQKVATSHLELQLIDYDFVYAPRNNKKTNNIK